MRPSRSGDVDVAVLAAEAQPGGEMRSHLVAVQHLDSLARGAQLLGQGVGDGGLAGRGQTGEPQACAPPGASRGVLDLMRPGSSHRRSRSGRSQVDPAFGLGQSGPAPGPRIVGRTLQVQGSQPMEV